MENDEDSPLAFELKRPSLLATLLWGLGFATWALTIYAIVAWHGWITSVESWLLVILSFVCGLNSMAVGFLIDMHSLEYRGVKFGVERRKREKKDR
ncbi:MAG: hypothetical protein QW056_02390 [Candidatus Bathyarchaeia archaeon]